jgi:modulator of FtsH protease HflC
MSDITAFESASIRHLSGRQFLLRAGAAPGTVLMLWWLTTCFVFVDETEVVLIERLGKIVSVLDQSDDRGLNVKLPWPVGTVRRFDRRTQLFDPVGREVFTRDKKNVTVDAFVCWKIADSNSSDDLLNRSAVRFFRGLGSVETAEARLETRLRSTLADRIAQVELTELMTVVDPESPPLRDSAVSLEQIASELLSDVRQRLDEEESVTDRLGIEIVDVRIKRINFPAGNQQAVFERMKSERQKIADRYRSAGLAQNTVIRSQADRQYNELISKADAEAERIRGQAEAEALAILNKAHARDPEFYRTMRTLDSYRKVLSEKTTLVLSASSSLLKLFVEGVPEATDGKLMVAPQSVSPDPTTKLEPAPAGDNSEAPGAKVQPTETEQPATTSQQESSRE